MSRKATFTDAKSGTPVTPKDGRPPINGKPMSAAERQRRCRARQKTRPKPVKDASEIFADICASRGITSALHRMLAEQATNAFIEGRTLEGVKILDALPAPVRAEAAGKTIGTSEAKRLFLEGVMNVIAADRFETCPPC